MDISLTKLIKMIGNTLKTFPLNIHYKTHGVENRNPVGVKSQSRSINGLMKYRLDVDNENKCFDKMNSRNEKLIETISTNADTNINLYNSSKPNSTSAANINLISSHYFEEPHSDKKIESKRSKGKMKKIKVLKNIPNLSTCNLIKNRSQISYNLKSTKNSKVSLPQIKKTLSKTKSSKFLTSFVHKFHEEEKLILSYNKRTHSELKRTQMRSSKNKQVDNSLEFLGRDNIKIDPQAMVNRSGNNNTIIPVNKQNIFGKFFFLSKLNENSALKFKKFFTERYGDVKLTNNLRVMTETDEEFGEHVPRLETGQEIDNNRMISIIRTLQTCKAKSFSKNKKNMKRNSK